MAERLPDKSVAVHPALKAFVRDVALGRAGTLVAWQGGRGNRAYASIYAQPRTRAKIPK